MTPLERFTELLGFDVFFVPCRWRSKKPLCNYVDRPFDSTKAPDYIGWFDEQTNIAVYLGEASGGLCALDFDADDDLETFLELNPRLRSTTHSCGSRGGMLWVRIAGDYPASCSPAHSHYEWRANRRLSMIYGKHPEGMDYTLVVDSPPITIPFDEIVWPEGWTPPEAEEGSTDDPITLEHKFGKPFYLTVNEDRVATINERYWAGLYAHENRVLYDPDDRTFYQYCEDSGLWLPVTTELIREVISARMLEVSREVGQPSLETKITGSKLNHVVNAIKGIAEKRGVFRSKNRLIHTANGVIRFTDDGDVQFGHFSPEDYSRNRSPYSYDPSARCPRFLSELVHPAVSPEDVKLLQRYFGLALFGYNLPQRMLILDGIPNGGKGTLVRILQGLVGGENCQQLRTDCLLERFETFRFRHKTLLIGPDVPGNFLMHKGASVLKILVGGDPISAEGKGSNGDFQMFGTFNVILTSNSRLRVRLEGDVGAWRRRLLIIRFENPPPNKRVLDFDRLLLEEEGSGILNWALAGFVELQQEFDTVGDFYLTELQRVRVSSLLDESDSVRHFVELRLERTPSSDITSEEATGAYAQFCTEQGWNPLPIKTVATQLAENILSLLQSPRSHSIERDGRQSQRGWRNVGLVK